MGERNGDFWTLLGWCLAWIGFGSCVYLANHSGPIISINLDHKTNGAVEVEQRH